MTRLFLFLFVLFVFTYFYFIFFVLIYLPANVVRKAAGNYGISMKEILQAPVSPVIEQQGKLQAAPWVNLVCSGMFCILFYLFNLYYII